MKEQILKLTMDLKKLVDKEAEKEKKQPEGQPKVFTEFSKDLQFYIDELS